MSPVAWMLLGVVLAHASDQRRPAEGCPVAVESSEEVDTVDHAELVARLREYADAEDGPVFMRWPDRWWEVAHWRCVNGHVSMMVLKSEELGRDACLGCMGPLALTFPEDVDGPLPARSAT